MTSPLEAGSGFPALTAKDLEGNDVDIAGSVAGHWSFVQFYRGHW